MLRRPHASWPMSARRMRPMCCNRKSSRSRPRSTPDGAAPLYRGLSSAHCNCGRARPAAGSARRRSQQRADAAAFARHYPCAKSCRSARGPGGPCCRGAVAQRPPRSRARRDTPRRRAVEQRTGSGEPEYSSRCAVLRLSIDRSAAVEPQPGEHRCCAGCCRTGAGGGRARAACAATFRRAAYRAIQQRCCAVCSI